jgi:hypothetical protein
MRYRRKLSLILMLAGIYLITGIMFTNLHHVKAEQQSHSITTNCSGGSSQLCQTITCIQNQLCYISKSTNPIVTTQPLEDASTTQPLEDASTTQPLEDASTTQPLEDAGRRTIEEEVPTTAPFILPLPATVDWAGRRTIEEEVPTTAPFILPLPATVDCIPDPNNFRRATGTIESGQTETCTFRNITPFWTG